MSKRKTSADAFTVNTSTAHFVTKEPEPAQPPKRLSELVADLERSSDFLTQECANLKQTIINLSESESTWKNKCLGEEAANKTRKSRIAELENYTAMGGVSSVFLLIALFVSLIFNFKLLP